MSKKLFSILGMVGLVLLTTASFGFAYEKHVNCGGQGYTAANGDVYIADQEYSIENGYGYVSGEAASVSDPIANTEDDILYQSNRFGTVAYKFDVPNGFYNVSFKFAETYFTEANQRRFNIYLEGQKVLPDLDIFSKAGHDTALDYQFTIKVADGQLNIDTEAISNYPSISAISVITASTYEKKINCGGGIYTSQNGDIYIADQEYSTQNGVGYITGTATTVTDPISGTEDDALYQSERWGDVAYKFDVPNGFYEVTLKLAENYHEEINKRVFSVWLEDKLVLENIDIFGLTGHDAALDYQFIVRVLDGQLNITTSSDIGSPKFSAISVVTAPDYYEKHINCGGNAFTAQNGEIYITDQEYSQENGAGYVDGNAATVTDPIAGTEDDALYQSERWGDFVYRFDVPNGYYEVTLKFAETYFTEVDRRRFNIWAEGNLVLENFDIYALAGHDTALDRKFIVKVSDGQLNITSTSYVDCPKFSAISVVTALTYEKGINCGGNPYIALNGDVYIADQQYSAENGAGYIDGNASSVNDPIAGTEDDSIYQSDRWGVNGYKFDVPDGFYDVTLKFAETYFTEAGQRVFNVNLENHQVIQDFDIYAEAGHDTALDKKFTVKVSDGQLNIAVSASQNLPKISAILVASSQDIFLGYPSEILEDFDGQNERVDYWWNSDAAPVYTRTFNNQIYRDGATSMKVVYNKLEGFSSSFFGLHPNNNVYDKDFSKFNKLAFWVYTNDPQLTIKVKFQDSLWRSWEQDVSSAQQGQWERFVYDFSEHGDMNLKDIQGVMFFVAPGQENVSGTFYIDGLTLVSSNAYVPLSTDTPEITTSGETEVYGAYSVQWTDESNGGDGATVYEIWESDDSDFSNPRIFWRNDPLLDFLKKTTPGVYYYKVRAWTDLPENGGVSSGWSNTIWLEVIDGPPVIDEVYSQVGGDNDNDYPVGSYVKICLKEKFDAPDIISGTVRITSASQSYDSGVQTLTKSSDGSYYFYHWNTNGLNSANDYVVATTLTDAIDQTDSDGSDANPDLTISLNLEKPIRYGTASATDLSIKCRGGMTMAFTRYYHSEKWADSAIGYNWVHNYDIHLNEAEDGAVELWDEHGYWYFFVRNPDGTYKTPQDADYTLTKKPDGTFTLMRRHGILYYDFNNSNRLAAIRDLNDNQITLTYNPNGWLTTLTDPSGRQVTFSYNAYGDITSMTDFAGRTIAYDYDTSGNLIEVTDPAENVTTYNYDGHNLITITNPRGYHTYFTYVGDKLLSQTNDNEINYTTYTSLSNPERLIVTNARGYETTYVNQDTNHYSIVDALDYTTAIVTDNDGNPTSITNPKNKTWSYTWDGYGNPLTQIDPYSKTTTYTYESIFHKIKSMTDANDKTTTYYYDYEEATLGDLNGDEITNEENGNLVRIKDPYDKTIMMVYNQYGQITRTTDKNGNITRYEYNNPTGMVTKITKQMGANPDPDADLITTMQYDTRGNLETLTDPNGHTTTFDYDLLDRLIRVTDALGNKVEYTYDGNDNVTLVTYKDSSDTVLQTVSKEYDEVDRLKKVIDYLNNFTTYEYDKNGNLTKVTDAEGNITSYSYDERDALILKTDDLGHTTTYDYHETGKLKSMTDDNDHITAYYYDDADRIKTIRYPDLSEETYEEYDNVGNLIKKLNRAGERITYAYDDLNRLEIKTYPDTSTVTYTYDDGSRLLSATDSNGTITYSYDRADRLTSVTDVYNKVVSYEYDKASNRTKLTYPDSTYITYVYDALNRLANIKNSSGADIATYGYDDLSRRTSLTLENGTQTTYAYDNINRLTNLVNKKITPETILSSFGYTLYDNVGNNLTKVTQEGTFSYAYNDVYELEQVTDPEENVTSYNYDGVRNRTTAEGQSYTVNNLNQYTAIDSTSYTYDLKGNLTSDGTWTYAYDYENRLISTTDGATEADYAYDYSGRRIAKTVDGLTTRYIYDGTDIIAEYDLSGNLLKEHIFGSGIDEILSTIDYGLSTTYYYHKDRLGSTVTVTNSSADIVEKYFYDAYGNVIIKDANDNVLSQSAIGNRYMFTGREYDAETGLYYYRARMYSSALGRFLQPDPIGYYDSENVYQYCRNNVINYIDPFGLCVKNLDEKIKDIINEELDKLKKFYDPYNAFPNQEAIPYDKNLDGIPDGVGIDLDGDGEIDGGSWDTNGDNVPDNFDINGDDKADLGFSDINGDGTPDSAWGDYTGDGKADFEWNDQNGDGDMQYGEMQWNNPW